MKMLKRDSNARPIACMLVLVSLSALHPVKAELDQPRVYLNISGDDGRGQVIFEVPVPIIRWNVSGPEALYTVTFQTNKTRAKAFYNDSFAQAVESTWRLPFDVMFAFQRNFFAQSSIDTSTRMILKNGYPEIRVPLQNFTRTAPRPLTAPFSFSEEVQLDCVDRNTSEEYNQETDKTLLYNRAPLNCSCDPNTDDSCFFCQNSGRYYQLRLRQNMRLPIRVANFSMYLKDNVDAPYATTMGLRTTITLQGPNQTTLTDIREGFTIDRFYAANWSPYVWDPFRPPRTMPQTYPHSSFERLVKLVGKAYPQELNGGGVEYPDDGTTNTTSLLDYLILTNITEPGLIVSKLKYSQGYNVWTEGLVLSTKDWKLRKEDACRNKTDHFLSTNYDTVANRVSMASNPVRQCVPLGDRKLELSTCHINELGFPADYPYATAIPNPLVTHPRPEGQLLVAQTYRLSCDFNSNYYAPVYSFVMNRTELEWTGDPAVEWPPILLNTPTSNHPPDPLQPIPPQSASFRLATAIAITSLIPIVTRFFV